MKTRTWLLLFGILFLVFLGLALLLGRPGSAQTAEIYIDGTLYRAIDLRTDQSFTIDSEYGSNTVTVCGGKIAVTDASCPDHVCINRGYCAGGMDIICLPNHLTIHFPYSSAPDGVLG